MPSISVNVRRVVWGTLIAGWCATVGAGFVVASRYTYTPGPAATAPRTWPSTSLRRGKGPTLVMVVHPECACSQTSLEELSRVLTRAPSAVPVFLLFDALDGLRDPAATSLWGTASTIPGATLVVDHNGREAALFGAQVSGQTYVFDPAGSLIFSGGITAGRGHAGDNDGAAAVATALATGRSPIASFNVFGCLLETRVRS